MSSLFIGLGGAGISSVAEFAKKAMDRNSNQGNEFVYIDTDIYMSNKYPFIGGDFLSLSGSMTPYQVCRRAEMLAADSHSSENERKHYQHFLRWYDTHNPQLFCNHPLNISSDVVPMFARAMLFMDYNRIKRQIRSKLFYVDIDGSLKPRDVFVVSGTCGGTGNGILIDILYMLCEIQNAQSQQFPVNLLLVMPEGYIHGLRGPVDILYEKYCLNAYALFDEINACLKDYYGFLGEDAEHHAGMQWNKYRCLEADPPIQFRVFDNAFLFDSISFLGGNMTFQDVAEYVADFLFILKVGSQANGALNTHISNEVRNEKFNSAGAPFIKAFAATGMFVAQTWEELTRKYVHDKFLYQMLHYGFGGSDEKMIEYTMTSLDDMVFRSHMDEIVKNKDGRLKDLLTTLLNDCSRDQFKAIVGNINRLREASGQKVDMRDVFAPCNNQAIPVEMERDIQELLREVCQMTYSCCAEWSIKYSLGHALMLAKWMQDWAQQHYKFLCERFVNMEIATLLILGKQRIIRDCETLFHEYVLCLLFNNLSQDYLVHCIENLSAALRENGGFDDRIDRGWEEQFTRYVFLLKDDRSKLLLPSLDHLIDGVHLARGNDIEQKYAVLVQQSENGEAPQLDYNLGYNRLLYTYKQKCLEAIEAENSTWEMCFDMNTEPNNFAKNVRKAFEAFAKQVEIVATEISQDNSLSMPFSQLILSNEERDLLVRQLTSFSDVNLNRMARPYHSPSIGIYIADFYNMPWLQNFLINNNPQLGQYAVNNNTMLDRIVKLNIEFGYSPDDYRYYYDRYKVEFDRCLQSPERYRHHQPFIDKRFMTERRPGETLADMFERTS